MSKAMYRITFANGYQITSHLHVDEVVKRRNRLNTLIALTEGYSEGEGVDICKKALKAFNKKDNFTGIIRLSFLEKDFLGYRLEDDMLTDEDIECLKFYTGCTDEDVARAQSDPYSFL